MKNKIINGAPKGIIHIECLDKNTVHIEFDNEGCKYLIEALTDFIKIPNMHHLDLEANTMYDLGIFTKDSLSLMINYRDNSDNSKLS